MWFLNMEQAIVNPVCVYKMVFSTGCDWPPVSDMQFKDLKQVVSGPKIQIILSKYY